jgi:hypothetical protein
MTTYEREAARAAHLARWFAAHKPAATVRGATTTETHRQQQRAVWYARAAQSRHTRRRGGFASSEKGQTQCKNI